jgi:hypothetical protein
MASQLMQGGCAIPAHLLAAAAAAAAAVTLLLREGGRERNRPAHSTATQPPSPVGPLARGRGRVEKEVCHRGQCWKMEIQDSKKKQGER